MDLHTGQSIWTARSSPPVYSPLSADLTCDVAVVGAGITGALAGYELAKRGLKTVVLDRRDACMGSTAACTALVQYELDRTLGELTGQLGWEHGSAAYRVCRGALDDLAKLINEIGQGCDFIDRPSLFLARKDEDVPRLEAETAVRRRIGLEVNFLSKEELREQFGIERPGAILSEVAYALDPVKLTARLLRAAMQRGARVFVKTEIDLERTGTGGHVLRTAGGTVVRCAHLILASGYETPEQFRDIGELCRLKSTYALATAPLALAAPWPRSALIWEMGEPYSYARTTSDHRVMVGGEDEDIVDAEKRDALIPAKMERLLTKLRALFPHLKVEPEFCWAGTFAQTDDGLPYIGQHGRHPGCYFALGYGGNGITFSMLAARIIADQIQGSPNPDAKWFGFDRVKKKIEIH